MDTEVAPHMFRPARTLLATVAAALLTVAMLALTLLVRIEIGSP